MKLCFIMDAFDELYRVHANLIPKDVAIYTFGVWYVVWFLYREVLG